jgi:hypothetical protein
MVLIILQAHCCIAPTFSSSFYGPEWITEVKEPSSGHYSSSFEARGSSKYLQTQFVPQRKHNEFTLQRSGRWSLLTLRIIRNHNTLYWQNASLLNVEVGAGTYTRHWVQYGGMTSVDASKRISSLKSPKHYWRQKVCNPVSKVTYQISNKKLEQAKGLTRKRRRKCREEFGMRSWPTWSYNLGNHL